MTNGTFHSHPFIGVVLAGGKSSRMGKDKGQLRLGNESLTERATRLLTNIGAREVLVSCNDFSVGSVPDIFPGHGPLSGIHSALFYSDLPVLCMPVDMPNVSERTLLKLVEVGIAMESTVHYINHQLPLFVANTDHAKCYLEHVLTTEQNKSVRRFISAVSSAQFVASDESELINTNTPEQWQNFLIEKGL